MYISKLTTGELLIFELVLEAEETGLSVPLEGFVASWPIFFKLIL